MSESKLQGNRFRSVRKQERTYGRADRIQSNICLVMAVVISIGAMMGPGVFGFPMEVATSVGPLAIMDYELMGGRYRHDHGTGTTRTRALCRAGQFWHLQTGQSLRSKRGGRRHVGERVARFYACRMIFSSRKGRSCESLDGMTVRHKNAFLPIRLWDNEAVMSRKVAGPLR